MLFGSQTWIKTQDRNGDETGMGRNPIFPPVETVRALRDLEGVNTSLHLCGRYARKAAGEEPDGAGAEIPGQGLRPGPGEPPRGRGKSRQRQDRPRQNQELRRADREPAASSCSTGAHGRTYPWTIPGIEYLFDLSEGAGVEGFERWPEPPEGRRAGYAGGLGPHNILRALEFAGRYPEARIWFDMERNVRTPEYLFDLEKVREVCQAAFDGERNP